MPSKATDQEIQATFAVALANGGAKFDCGSHGEAMSIRTRLNNWRAGHRALTREMFRDNPGDPRYGVTWYDCLSMHVPHKDAPDANILYITKRSPLVAMSLDGRPLVTEQLPEPKEPAIIPRMDRPPLTIDDIVFDIAPEK